MIARQGDLGDSAYIVEKGQCAMFKEEDGAEIFLRHLFVNDVFGVTALERGRSLRPCFH